MADKEKCSKCNGRGRVLVPGPGGFALAERDALLVALKNIVWKLNRDESPSGQGDDCVPAKIDRNDAVIRAAAEIISQI